MKNKEFIEKLESVLAELKSRQLKEDLANEEMCTPGDFFLVGGDGCMGEELAILASTDEENICLVSLYNGNRWRNSRAFPHTILCDALYYKLQDVQQLSGYPIKKISKQEAANHLTTMTL